MDKQKERLKTFNINLQKFDTVRIEEIFRLGALRDGIQLTTTDIKFPIFGQVIPRIELEIFGKDFHKKITVRINQHSSFAFNGETLSAFINNEYYEMPCHQFVDEGRAPTGMYNFGLMRENGVRSFVFDYHTYCAYSCDFCFKENEWEVLAVQGNGSNNYKANYDECIQFIDEKGHTFQDKYDIVWLCTGSLVNEKLELNRHTQIASALRNAGYENGIYVSQVVPPGIRNDREKRMDYLWELKNAGVSRFNSGVEIVDSQLRQKYIHGFKSTYTFDDYVNIFTDAVSVFGHFNVGSCLLAGIEDADKTIDGLDTIAKIGVVPSPTVFTPFVIKQMNIPFAFDLDTLIDTHVAFNNIIKRYDLPVFSGVFSLA